MPSPPLLFQAQCDEARLAGMDAGLPPKLLKVTANFCWGVGRGAGGGDEDEEAVSGRAALGRGWQKRRV